jgi:hypothetical protein
MEVIGVIVKRDVVVMQIMGLVNSDYQDQDSSFETEKSKS